MSDLNQRVGLCLAGGGITGAMYEVGALAAFEDSLVDFKANEFSAYVGVGAGSIVATALAAGMDAQRMYRALLNPNDDLFPLQRSHLLRMDPREIRRVLRAITGALRSYLASLATEPLKLDAWTEIDRFYDSLPAGLFSIQPFAEFLESVFRRRGVPQSFSEFRSPLYVIANDIDRGEALVFGKGQLEEFAVSEAIAAACAVPLVFAPYRLGDFDVVAASGAESVHIDLAAAHCKTIVVINPMVPIKTDFNAKDVPTGHGKGRRVRDKGLLWVYNQSLRIITEARLQRSVDEYKSAHPKQSILLLEPNQDDATVFMYSPMNFDARRAILEEAYRSTAERIQDTRSTLHQGLIKCGFQMRSNGEAALAT